MPRTFIRGRPPVTRLCCRSAEVGRPGRIGADRGGFDAGLRDLCLQIALVIALLTMTLGNVVALWQDNVRRLLAYSAIAHGGYMLIGLAVAFAAASGADAATGFDGIGGMLFYIAVYSLATTGAFATLIYLGRDERPIDAVDELAGIGRTHPWAGLSMAIFMFSLTGIPPLAGFWGKLNLFAGALSVRAPQTGDGVPREWFLLLALVGVLNAAVSAGYYLRIVGVMYFRPSPRELKAQAAWGPAPPCFCARLWSCWSASSRTRFRSAPMPRPVCTHAGHAIRHAGSAGRCTSDKARRANCHGPCRSVAASANQRTATASARSFS